MRPLRLSLEAFGPYAGSELIDFESLRAAGLFVVSGPTGSGKSSIFDALSYALYGELPGARKGARSIRSDHAPAGRPCEVTLEFVAANQTWRVTRRPSFERPKKRGTGTMTADAEVTLARLHEGSWQGVESKLREVDEKCKELVGLDFAQFQRVVLLPQGGFSQVLNAKSSDRQGLLRTLFSSEIFDRASAKLKELSKIETSALRAKQDLVAERVLQARSSLSSALTDALLEVEVAEDVSVAGIEKILLQNLKPRLTEMVEELVVLKKAEVSVRDRLVESERVAKSMNRFVELTTKVEKLDAQKSDIEKLSRRIEASIAAASVLKDLAACDEAANDLATSTLAEQSASKELLALAEGLELPAVLSAGSLLELGSKFDLEREGFVHLLKTQDDLSRKQESQDKAEVALAVEVVALQDTKEKLNSLTLAKAKLSQDVDQAEKISQLLPVLEKNYLLAAETAEALKRLRHLRAELLDTETQAQDAAKSKAKRVNELEALLEKAEGSEKAAAERLRDGEASYEVTLLDFIESTAPRLAAKLSIGEPCSVCGSKSHPNPAAGGEIRSLDELKLSQDLVSESGEALKNAAGKSQDALAALQLALSIDADSERIDNALVVLKTQQAVLLKELGSASEPDVESDLTSKLTTLQNAKRAVGNLTEDKGTLENLAETLRITSLSSAKQETLVSERRLVVEDASKKLEAETSGLATELAGLDPQAQIDTRNAQRGALSILVDVSQQRSTHEALASSLKTALTNSLLASPFDSNEDVRSASLDELEAKSLELTTASWRKDVTETNTLLKQLEAEDLPEQIPDLEHLKALCVEVAKERDTKSEAMTAAKTHLEVVETGIASLGLLGTEIAESLRLAEELKEVADVCSGSNPKRVSLEAWVLGAYLREVVAQANLHLLPMSSGRYSLAVGDEASDKRTSSGLDLVVQDAHTGRSRPASSLSGGETFQASLALALGLADVVTAGRSGLELDCIFIDEGFGSLDPDSLELAIDVLDGLRSRGSLVGVITHVGALKEALELGIEVRPLASGEGSTLRQFA